MNLVEYQGKELFARYNLPIPKSKIVTKRNSTLPFKPPFILKSQVPVGDRKRKGGIAIVKAKRDYSQARQQLFKTSIDGHLPEKLLAEELVLFEREDYVSFSFDTDTRMPLLALSSSGGTGIHHAFTTPIDLISPAVAVSEGGADFFLRDALRQAEMPQDRSLVKVIQSLWKLFRAEKALLAEINPLFALKDGSYVAGDAKVILDDHVAQPDFRPYVSLGGDIAVLASGGGASMVNLDALFSAGGRPANYVEYSGNPKSDVVRALTRQVLSQPNLKGCWVVGGTANFTDVYETLKGFVEGLREIKPKPNYPIVIRRDGPRRQEAFELLEKVKREEGFNFYLFGPNTPMADSAKTIVKLAYTRYGHSR